MMVPVVGHLGTRVSALLDGRMPAAEEERWWAHVHQCHPCRDLVEREGFVKTRLAGLSHGDAGASERLKHSLLAAPPLVPLVPLEARGDEPVPARGRSAFVGGMVGGVIGSGAVGAAVVGVLALGAGPANTPQFERRAPVTSLTRPSPTPTPTPTSTVTPSGRRGADAEPRRAGTVQQGAIREKMGP